MISQKVLITNPSGLHARPAHHFMAFIKKFKCEVILQVGETAINCKSIVNLLLAAIKPGTTVEVRVHGEDEQEALELIVEFLESMKE